MGVMTAGHGDHLLFGENLLRKGVYRTGGRWLLQGGGAPEQKMAFPEKKAHRFRRWGEI